MKSVDLNQRTDNTMAKEKEQRTNMWQRRVTLVTNLDISYIVLFSVFLTFSLIIFCASHLTERVFSISIIN